VSRRRARFKKNTVSGIAAEWRKPTEKGEFTVRGIPASGRALGLNRQSAGFSFRSERLPRSSRVRSVGVKLSENKKCPHCDGCSTRFKISGHYKARKTAPLLDQFASG